jgi:hypothetical protein
MPHEKERETEPGKHAKLDNNDGVEMESEKR